MRMGEAHARHGFKPSGDIITGELWVSLVPEVKM